MADVTFTISIKDDGTPVIREIKREAEAMGTGVANAGQKASGGLTSVSTAAKGVAGAFGAIGAAAIAQQFISLADTARNLEGRLKLVTSSQQELTQTQTALFAVAQQTRVGYEGTVDLYTRLSRSTKQLNTDQSTLLQITQTINQTLAISGASAESANAALVQLGQGLASGALRGDEFNSVIEQTPRLAQAIADGMGVTLGQLRALANDGKLTAETVVGALQKQRDAVEREFGQLPVTVGQAMTLVGNSILKAVGEFDKATGASEFLANKIRDLATAVDFTVDHIQQKLEGLKLNRILELKKEISDIQVQLESGARLISTSAGTVDFPTAIALQSRLTETLQGLRSEFQATGAAAAAAAPKIASLTPEQLKAQESAQKLIDRLKEQVAVYGLHGGALADAVAKQALAEGATTAQAESIRSLTLALEQKKAAEKAATEATKETEKAARDAQKAEEDRVEEVLRAGLLVNKLAHELEQIRQKEAEDIKKATDAVKSQTAAYQLEASVYKQVISGAKGYDDAIRELAISQKAAELTAKGLGDQAQKLATDLVDAEIAANKTRDAADDLNSIKFDFGDRAADAAARMAEGILLGTRKASDALAALKDFGVGVFVDMFAETIRQKLKWEATLSGNLLNDLPNLFAQSGQASQGGFLDSLFGGSGGGGLRSLFGGAVSGQGLLPSIFGSNVTGSGGLLGGVFGSPGTIPGFGGVGPNIPGTGIFSGGNPFSFGNLAGGFAGGLIGGGISGALGIGQSKPGQLGGGIGGTVGGFGGGIVGGALLGAQFGAFAGPIGAAVGAIIGTILGGVAGDLFKPGRIATEKKDINKLFKEVFPDDKFKVLKEPQVASGFSTFGDQSNAALALGALYASGQKGATAGTAKRFGGQFLGNLAGQGQSSEEATAATLKLAEALGADLPTAISKANELVDKGVLSNAQFAKQMNDSRKNLKEYGDTTGLTAQQLTDLALKNGNVGSTVVTLNKLYAGAIDIATGFSGAVDSAAIANGLLADKFVETAGGADKANGAVGDLAGKVRDGSLSIEEAVQQLNSMRAAAGETQLALNQFTLNPDKVAAELGLIQASIVEAGEAAKGLTGVLSAAILGDLETLGPNVDKFFQDLFGQQILGSILQKSVESLQIEKTLAPVFEKLLRAQADFADGTLDQAGFEGRLKDILADAGPEIDKIKAGLLAAGESGQALLRALGLLPEAAEEGADAVDTIADKAETVADRFAAAFDSVGSSLAGAAQSYYQQLDQLASKSAYDAALDANVATAARGGSGTPANPPVNALKQLQRQVADTGTSGQAIGRALAAQFAQGFEDGLDELILNAALIEAKVKPLQEAISKMIQERTKDGVLSAQDQADIANFTAAGVKDLKATAETLTPALDGVHAAAKQIEQGSEVSADNFRDIQLTTAATADESAAIESSLGEASDKMDEVSLSATVLEAQQIRDFLSQGAASLSGVSLSAPQTTGFAAGGYVPGSGNTDSVPAMLMPGEYVVSKDKAVKYAHLIAAMEADTVQHFAGGGGVNSSLNLGRRARQELFDANTTGPNRFPLKEVGAQIWKIISDQVLGFIGTDNAGGGLSSQLAQIRSDYQQAAEALTANRKALTAGGIAVDEYLGKLSEEFPKKLQAAWEQANQALADAPKQLGDTISSLLTGSTSPLSSFEKTALLQGKADTLRSRLPGATDAELPAILNDLSGVLQEQLSLSPFDRFSEDFRSQFFAIVSELKQLQSQAQARIDASAEVNLTINVNSGSPQEIEEVVARSIRERGGKINQALRGRG